MENSLKEKLKNVRTTCPGMSEDLYVITDYMSKVVNTPTTVKAFAITMVGLMDDINNGKCGFTKKVEIPKEFILRKNQVLAQLPNVIQVIDEICEEQFANNFRSICLEVFGFNPPKRTNASLGNNYPEYIEQAVNWWANAIQTTNFDMGEEVPMAIFNLLSSNKKSKTAKEIKIFKESLAKSIMGRINLLGYCNLDVDYTPDEILSNAGSLIKLDMFDFPIKTHMIINKEKVEVSSGYGAPYQIIWESENLQNSHHHI